MITQDRLVDLFEYSPETGEFRWRRPVGRAKNPAGSMSGDGYTCIWIDGRMYRMHRLAWLYVHGRWPDHEIDHINGNRADNRIANLREATRVQNMMNLQRSHSDSALGFLGVTRSHNKGKPYRAQLMVNGRRAFTGYFSSPEEAHAAYLEAKNRISNEE